MDVDDSRTDPDPRLDDLGDKDKMADSSSKPRYKSWKKKYRKMRMKFDQRVHDSDELHKKELRGIEACKRIAIENDRILDILHDINSSAQIPLSKRIALSSSPSHGDSDDSGATEPARLSKSLKDLKSTVSHLGFEEAAKAGVLDDIEHPSTLPNADPDAKPPSFLTADDIDNYLFEIDSRIGGPGSHLPTLAPLAHHGRRAADLATGSVSAATTNGANGHGTHAIHAVPSTAPASSSSSYQLRNPSSVYNWLRRHCPHVFLQDAEKDSKDDGAVEKTTSKSKASTGRGGARATKRASKAQRGTSMDIEPEEDDGGTPAPPTTGRSKRKRADDDSHRAKASNPRPTKKKRKSEAVDTPTVKRPRKVKKEISDELVRDVDMEGEGDATTEEK